MAVMRGGFDVEGPLMRLEVEQREFGKTVFGARVRVSRNATEEEIKSALYHGRIAVDAQLLEMTRFASGAVVYDYFSPSPIDDFVEREVMVRATTQSPVYITQEMVADGMD